MSARVLDFGRKFHGATFLGRLLRLPLKLLPPGLMVPTLSGVNRGMSWKVGSGTHGCWLGIYEKDKQELVSGLVRPGMRAVDIGANAGFYTLAFSRLVGEGGKVWALEPLAQNVVNLQAHVRVNKCTNVSIVQAAAADSAGLSGFAVGANSSVGALGSTSGLLVPTVTLDGLIAAGQIEPPDIVKMDVEGAESRVLQGATTLLLLRKTTWLVALHGVGQRPTVIDTFRANGYRVMTLDRSDVGEEFTGDEICATPSS